MPLQGFRAAPGLGGQGCQGGGCGGVGDERPHDRGVVAGGLVTAGKRVPAGGAPPPVGAFCGGAVLFRCVPADRAARSVRWHWIIQPADP